MQKKVTLYATIEQCNEPDFETGNLWKRTFLRALKEFQIHNVPKECQHDVSKCDAYHVSYYEIFPDKLGQRVQDLLTFIYLPRQFATNSKFSNFTLLGHNIELHLSRSVAGKVQTI